MRSDDELVKRDGWLAREEEKWWALKRRHRNLIHVLTVGAILLAIYFDGVRVTDAAFLSSTLAAELWP